MYRTSRRVDRNGRVVVGGIMYRVLLEPFSVAELEICPGEVALICPDGKRVCLSPETVHGGTFA